MDPTPAQWKQSVLPAIGLFFLAPLVAEFLLGNLSITMLSALIVLAPSYGGGALLIRELVRRSGRGWPTMVLLALAYGILEEAFTTQSLFNPNYLSLNMHLLQPAYIPALGIGGWWTVFVLALHTVWRSEEAFRTQSLFNPNYLSLNMHLLQPAYIPALGIGGWWTVFVLALHTVWSISVPIALLA